jgi:hypothetical protein
MKSPAKMITCTMWQVKGMVIAAGLPIFNGIFIPIIEFSLWHFNDGSFMMMF